ncbi:MAG: EamA family transporter [Vicinamibacterales bacterium]
MLTLPVFIRILANPVANVFQKQLTQRSAHPVFIIAMVHAALAVICVPFFLTSSALDVGPAVWTNMVIAALLAVSGNVLLVYALRETDLSVLGPINAYKSIVGMTLGIVLVGERPSQAGLAGVLLVVAGSYFVMDTRPHQPLAHAFVRFFSGRGIQLRFAALFLSAAEAVFLKRAIVLSSPWRVFALWSALGFLVAVAVLPILLRRQIAQQLRIVRESAGKYGGVVTATGLMQLATVLTFRDLQVGYSLALFQLSTVISVLLGRRYFAESNVRERLFGSFIMAAGAALIVVFGRRN